MCIIQTHSRKNSKKRPTFFHGNIKTASQDLSSTGLEGCLPASGTKAFHDWFSLQSRGFQLFSYLFFSFYFFAFFSAGSYTMRLYSLSSSRLLQQSAFFAGTQIVFRAVQSQKTSSLILLTPIGNVIVSREKQFANAR